MQTLKLPTLAPFALVLSALISSGMAVAQPRSSVPSFDFKGRFLVSISDADMLPSAYIDGKLGPVDGADALSIIRLDKTNRELRAVEISVTNSVTGPPASIAVTPDGRYALVIEARGQRPTKADPKLFDLSNGGTISVVDLADPDQPQVTQRIQGLERPFSVSINFKGTLVAVSYDAGGAGKTTPLAIYRFDGSKLSAPVTPAVPGWTTGETVNDVEWHPKENILALLNVFIQHCEDAGEVFEEGSSHGELHESLVPQPNDLVMRKYESSAFAGTDLASFLEGLQAKELVLCGLQSEFCVSNTAKSGLTKGFKVFIAQDGHRTWPSENELAIAISERVNQELEACGAQLRSTDNLIHSLHEART